VGEQSGGDAGAAVAAATGRPRGEADAEMKEAGRRRRGREGKERKRNE